MSTNVFNWVEIAVEDFDRAKKFYAKLMGVSLEVMDFGGYKMGFFPGYNEQIVSGAIVYGDGYFPSDKGTIVYFNANPDLQVMLDRVEAAGGTIIQPKKLISENYGFMALLLDTEGNRIALHSME